MLWPIVSSHERLDLVARRTPQPWLGGILRSEFRDSLEHHFSSFWKIHLQPLKLINIVLNAFRMFNSISWEMKQFNNLKLMYQYARINCNLKAVKLYFISGKKLTPNIYIYWMYTIIYNNFPSNKTAIFAHSDSNYIQNCRFMNTFLQFLLEYVYRQFNNYVN